MDGNRKTMPTSPLNKVIQHLLADLRPESGGLTDGELLVRFLRIRDENALAALVRKHARMVWGVCRRLLSHHDAEDAFQATFLVLVRKAADVPREAVANWLYGVARQTAVRLRTTAAKRGRRETQVVNMPEPTVPTAHDADVQAVVDEELSRLPDHYRGVVVLCGLEGMTRKAAARQLGIPEGSVASRLARARALLTKRLTQRGVVFTGSVTAVLSAGSASASAPPALVASTITAASLLAAGQAAGVVSAKIAALTEGVVRAMSVTKIKTVLAVALVFGLTLGGVGVGIGFSTHSAAVAQQPGSNPGDGAGEKPKTGGKADKERLKVLTPEEAIRQMPKEMPKVTVQFQVASVELVYKNKIGLGYSIYLHDGGRFTALMDRSADQFMNLQFMKHGIKVGTVVSEEKAKEVQKAAVEDFSGKVVRVTGRVEPDSGHSFQMWVHDLADIEIVKEEQNAPEKEQKSGEDKKLKAKEPMVAPPQQNMQKAVSGQRMEQFTGRLGKPQGDSIAVVFEVDERSYLEYQRLLLKHQVEGPGSPLFVGLADEKGFPHRGTLKGFDDSINPATGTVRTHATLPNPDRLLLEGMFVRIRMPFGPSKDQDDKKPPADKAKPTAKP